MSIITIGLIGVCSLLVIIFLDMPVGLAMAGVGFVGMVCLRGWGAGLSVLGTEPFTTATTYSFTAIPLFIALGFLASEIKLSDDGFYVVNKWIGHQPGGLTMAATVGCAMFAAISGDAISTATSMCSASLPVMRKHKYADVLSLGCLASSGNLGFLIPPSIGFIVYAIFTQQSIGTLFMSGILPGILLTILFLFTIWLWCRINPRLAPASEVSSWGERFRSLPYITGPVILIILILGGMYGGIFTATEAAAVGVFAAVIMGLITRRLTWKGFTSCLRQGAMLSGKIFTLVIGAIILSRFITSSEIPLYLADTISTLDIPPWAILWIFLMFYIAIGFIMDIMSVVVIVAPIVHPILVGMGFDGVWLAVLTLLTILMGQITPPVGIVVYGLSAYVPDVPIGTIFRGTFPFLAAMFVCLVILFFFPQISLFLPHLRPG